MRRTIVGAIAAAALSAGGIQLGFAADMPVKAVQKAPPVPLYIWNGVYFGGNVGYSWGTSDVTFGDVTITTDVGDVVVPGQASQRLKPDGIIGGVQLGWNWQPARNWVWGLETDFQWTGQKDSLTRSVDFEGECGVDCTFAGTASGSLESKLTWLGTLRGRIGFVADGLPTVLWYGTGGLAYGRVKTSGSLGVSGTLTDDGDCSNGGCDFAASGSFSAAKTRLGWTAGAGVEGALWDNWTAKVEYLYVDLGTARGTTPVSGSFTCTGGCDLADTFTGTAAYSNRMTDHIVRVGLNYRFIPFGPGR
jgi:outer membrane immunogenic protein